METDGVPPRYRAYEAQRTQWILSVSYKILEGPARSIPDNALKIAV